MRSADRCRRARREGHFVVTACRVLVSAPTPLLTVTIEGAVAAHIPPLEPRCGWLPRVVRLTWSAAAWARAGARPWKPTTRVELRGRGDGT